ncbi:MAG: thioredoxin domain-containing protein [Eudoraea sp.]|nr:thioredoxin domain-containing protein [Eudoraea sp.]
MPPKHTNSLIHETSPYLLQHAHNPVNWNAWNPEVLARAKKENSLILISIGYAACHWCHVMEHHCFEDEEVAEVMNAHFVNIKIDREERPDIDHIYMDALQMMTGSGGWPLNIVALPDGRPFWGATYVKKADWMNVLSQLATLHKTDPDKVIEYASNLTAGLRSINLVEIKNDQKIISKDQLQEAVATWSQYFDTFLGGHKRAPKFMMPGNLDFLLHYATAFNDNGTAEYVNTTLTRMAYGGIFDHIGGGFSRYAVDTKWHVPHFEKMLYDNAQLVSLYAKAYAATQNPLYKQVVEETIDFVTQELMTPDFAFYSSLDADSLDEKAVLKEGAYYVWKEADLKKLLNEDYPLFKEYYNINSYGYWEEDVYVLIRDASDNEIAKKFDISPEELEQKMQHFKELLKEFRSKRTPPRLDDKILTSWNGLMLVGLLDAYRYVGNEDYLKLALKNAVFIVDNLFKEDGSIFHNHKNGQSTINGFLEDYATIIQAFIGLYEVTFQESWLLKAKELSDYCLNHFMDKQSGLLFFTPDTEEVVVRRSLETTDNVIPASNSIMAINLFKLGQFFPETNYKSAALRMFTAMSPGIIDNPTSYANWMHLGLYVNFPFYEVAITGEEFLNISNDLRKVYLPNTIIAGSDTKSSLPVLKGRLKDNQTLIYVCLEGACQLPVSGVKEAIDLM